VYYKIETIEEMEKEAKEGMLLNLKLYVFVLGFTTSSCPCLIRVACVTSLLDAALARLPSLACLDGSSKEVLFGQKERGDARIVFQLLWVLNALNGLLPSFNKKGVFRIRLSCFLLFFTFYVCFSVLIPLFLFSFARRTLAAPSGRRPLHQQERHHQAHQAAQGGVHADRRGPAALVLRTDPGMTTTTTTTPFSRLALQVPVPVRRARGLLPVQRVGHRKGAEGARAEDQHGRQSHTLQDHEAEGQAAEGKVWLVF
jgi:hypothetical protein